MVQQPPPLPSSDFLFCRHSCTKHFCQGNARETVSALGFALASSHPPSSFYFSRSRSCRSSSSQRAFYARTRPRSARHVAWQRLPVRALLDQPLFVIAGAHYSVLPALILSVLAGGEAARMQRNMRAAVVTHQLRQPLLDAGLGVSLLVVRRVACHLVLVSAPPPVVALHRLSHPWVAPSRCQPREAPTWPTWPLHR